MEKITKKLEDGTIGTFTSAYEGPGSIVGYGSTAEGNGSPSKPGTTKKYNLNGKEVTSQFISLKILPVQSGNYVPTAKAWTRNLTEHQKDDLLFQYFINKAIEYEADADEKIIADSIKKPLDRVNLGTITFDREFLLYNADGTPRMDATETNKQARASNVKVVLFMGETPEEAIRREYRSRKRNKLADGKDTFVAPTVISGDATDADE